MWHKVTSGDLRDSSGSWKLKWHKNPEKEPCKKESGKTEKQNRTSSQSKLIYMVIWKEEGRMIAISKWWVECLKTHAELPHQDPAPTRDVCLELCLQEETMNIARDLTCQDEAEQGSGWREECELRNREASLGVFLLKGEMLTFWVWKVVMSDYIWNFIWQLFKTVWPGDDLKEEDGGSHKTESPLYPMVRGSLAVRQRRQPSWLLSWSLSPPRQDTWVKGKLRPWA